MISIPVYNLEGKETGTQDLPENIFDVKMNTTLLHRVVTVSQKNQRISTAHTKTRGEVRGGGRKPWKQKGTGRARAGSIRSPLWRGGGTTFGPRSERVYSGKVNKKERQAALKMVLSDLVRDNRFVVVESLELPEVKTKVLVTALAKLPVVGSTLLVSADKSEDLVRAGRNVQSLTTEHVGPLSPSSVLRHGTCVVTVDGLKKLIERFGAERQSAVRGRSVVTETA